MGAPFRIMPDYRRSAIAAEINAHLARVDLLVAQLDRADAPFEDLEPTWAEDDFQTFHSCYPGCPIADPGGCEHDGREIDDAI